MRCRAKPRHGRRAGYVLDGYESTEITGWRKSLDQVASFEFTALPDSYAARTGRPGNVGVIGIAMFNERPQPIAMRRDREAFGDTRRESSPVPVPAPSTLAQAPAADAAPPPAEKSTASPADAASSEARRASGFIAKRESLGTGHGAIENSTVRTTRFDRLQSTPNEIVTIHYDRRENLIAMGILPQRPLPPLAANPAANPFPNSGAFVPDPPSRR